MCVCVLGKEGGGLRSSLQAPDEMLCVHVLSTTTTKKKKLDVTQSFSFVYLRCKHPAHDILGTAFFFPPYCALCVCACLLRCGLRVTNRRKCQRRYSASFFFFFFSRENSKECQITANFCLADATFLVKKLPLTLLLDHPPRFTTRYYKGAHLQTNK